MTVSIDPSEVRARPSSRFPAGFAKPEIPPVPGRSLAPRAWWRMAVLPGLGAIAFAAFTYGAFSFFSGLADPRARAPLPKPMASSWPDLRDGVPALAKPAAKVAEVEPRPASTLAATPPVVTERTEGPTAPAAEPAKPAPLQAAISPSPSTQLRGNRPNLQIAPVETVGASTILSPIAPPRALATILPTKAETVRAKAVPTSFVSLPSEPDAAPEPRATVAAAEPDPVPSSTAETKPAANNAPKPKKPAATRTAAKPTRTAARAADEPAPEAEAAPAPAPKAASDEPGAFDGIPGGREIRHGVKAISEMFTGKSDGE